MRPISETLRMENEDAHVDRSQLGEARYSNFAEIGHNATEFVFDFGQGWVDEEPVRVYLRVVTTPDMAQELCKKLDEALMRYRVVFGEIRPGRNADEL